jgi:ABC-type uncharacterized transport system ATPase component
VGKKVTREHVTQAMSATDGQITVHQDHVDKDINSGRDNAVSIAFQSVIDGKQGMFRSTGGNSYSALAQLKKHRKYLEELLDQF